MITNKRARRRLAVLLCSIAVSWLVVPTAYGCGYTWFGDTWQNWVSVQFLWNSYDQLEEIQQVAASPASYNYGCANAYTPGYGSLWTNDICARVGYEAIGTASSPFYGEGKTINDSYHTQQMWGWDWEYDYLCIV